MHPRSYMRISDEDRRAIRRWWPWVIASYAALAALVLIVSGITHPAPSSAVAQDVSVNVFRAGN
jgi:hypothetical protein